MPKPAVKTSTAKPADAHHLGHRDRLRKRFQTAGHQALADYELLELLLMQFIPRRDVKPTAKAMLKMAGDNLHKVFDLSAAELKAIPGLGASTVQAFQVLQAVNARAKRQAVLGRPALDNKLDLLGYLYDAMTPLKHEELRIIYLDSKSRIIDEAVLFRGTLDSTAVYPREVMREALTRGAASLILVHNHPSGDPSPSQQDAVLTREMAAIASALNIELQDHIIIGDGMHYSFRDHGQL